MSFTLNVLHFQKTRLKMAENLMTSTEGLASSILKKSNKTFVANQKNLGISLTIYYYLLSILRSNQIFLQHKFTNYSQLFHFKKVPSKVFSFLRTHLVRKERLLR